MNSYRVKRFFSLNLLFLFLSLGISSTCNAQEKTISKNSPCKAFTCVNEVDEQEQLELKKQGKCKLQIYLIRHAKPDLKKKWFYSAAEARQYVIDYNTVPIIPFDPELVQVNLGPDHTIYCSNLPRSQETALTIFGDKYPVVSDSIFREYEIRMVNASSIIKLPLALWQAFSRGSWMLGYNHRGIESRKESIVRRRLAAENLVKVAHQEETAVLVAHGMLNGGIEKELKRMGWEVIQKKGQINLGATILVKIIEE